MIYVGMDISSKSFVVHAVNEKKRVVFTGAVEPSRAGLRQLMTALGAEPKRVVFEAGNQLKWLALWFKRRADVHLHVVHPNEVKWISQSSGKTDKIDAKKLAELARGDLLPRKVHIVEGPIRELRELLSARQTLLSKRVALINTIRAFVLQEGRPLPEKFFDRADWYGALTKVVRGGGPHHPELSRGHRRIEGRRGGAHGADRGDRGSAHRLAREHSQYRPLVRAGAAQCPR
jgi:transposase